MKIIIFENLNVACFKRNGDQIPEMQVSLPILLAEHAERIGYDLHGVSIEIGGQEWVMIKDENGKWNRRYA